MATFINTENNVSEENNVNFIPCSIDFNGRAKVSTYFKEKPESNEIKVASFRGRPLLGSEVEVPSGYNGYVLRKPSEPGTPKVFDVLQSFKKITYWNLDCAPSKNDSILSAFDWLDMSKAIHQKENPEGFFENHQKT